MKYQAGQTLLHRLHPVVKLAWLVWVTVAVFLFDSTALPMTAAALAALLLWFYRIPPWRIPGLKVWISLGVVILAAHALSVPQGQPLFGPVTIEGITSGIRAAGRLLAVILVSALFVTTTEPVLLACALIALGLPYRWGFALVTALRLVPIFRVEAHHIYQAQLVRGVAHDAGFPRKWWLTLRHLCLPLLVSALRTAHTLSLSMEGRAFGLHPKRTYMREVTVGRSDIVAAALLILTIVAAAWHIV
ncbi:MAG: energy-coupling factor transporter transmembrane protein EcfT [Phycisphaerales bacterium]|nr:MAG: energy-coupling factor transporter transmembrane protein EcfT [Phycisphaerales bacterium]